MTTTISSIRAVLRWLHRDQTGMTAVMTCLGATALIGFTGLGIDVASWQVTLRKMQGAADQAVLAAAVASSAGETLTEARTEAEAITASHGFVDGRVNVTVAVNQPPSQGSYITNSSALEVVIQQPQSLMFTGLFLSEAPTITTRAVALASGNGCVFTLNHANTTGVTVNGSTAVTLTSCSLYDNALGSTAFDLVGGGSGSNPFVATAAYVDGQITDNNSRFQGAEHTNQPRASDPYSSLPLSATGANYGKLDNKNSHYPNFSAGIYSSIDLKSSDSAALSAGTYYIEGKISIAGQATLTGTDVTIVATSSTGLSSGSYPNNQVSISGGASLNITAPTTGTYAGIAFYGDRNAPSSAGPASFEGGNTQNITGAIYFPSVDLKYAGGAASGTAGAALCTQLIAQDITFTGTSNFSLNCTGIGTKPIAKAALVE